MTVRAMLREAPPIRELLARATWDDLHKIATRHSVALGGRRRDLAVERLAAVLERPEQIRAAARILPDATRAVLSLCLLAGSVDDDRAIATALEALTAIRSDLRPTFARIHLMNEVQTLVSLGLVFRDRRRLAVPLEVLETLSPQFAPSTPAQAPHAEPHTFAHVQYRIARLMAALDEQQPIAIPPPSPVSDQAAVYHALLLPPDQAATLGTTIGVAPDDTAFLVTQLEVAGAISAVRGRWQIRADWLETAAGSPHDLLPALIGAWLQPHVASDLPPGSGLAWLSAPDIDAAAQIGQHEQQLRTLCWRWLRWCGEAAWSIADFAATFAALHSSRIVPDSRAITLINTRQRNAPLSIEDAPQAAQIFVQQWIKQLAQIGLIVSDGTAAVLTSAGSWLIHGSVSVPSEPMLRTAGTTDIFVQPLVTNPEVLRLLAIAGTLRTPDGEWTHYELTARGIGRLTKQQVTLADFEQTLRSAGAQFGDELHQQLQAWAARAGRLRVHAPLTVIVTAEDVPLAQVLSVAGLGDAAEVIGPGCALIEAERAEAAVEQLRARGFWPRIVN